jgi:Wax ester synthase/diacylglycerol acyltransferase catalytic domain/WS/DGAT C-terminal domain
MEKPTEHPIPRPMEQPIPEPMEQPIPLGAEDRAILELEDETVAGHTCKVVLMGAHAIDLPALRARFSERIATAPALCRRLGEAGRQPCWCACEDFDIAEHVVAAPVAGPLAREKLPALVARLFEQRLDRRRPLWRVDLVELAEGGSALVWRIHHALADGTACIRYGRLLLWDQQPEGAARASHHSAAHGVDDARRREHLAGFLRREYRPDAHRSPFAGVIGAHREVAFAAVPLTPLHEAASALDGATVNDAVLTLVAGALERWLAERHGHVGSLRVRVPVSLHQEGDSVANHDSFFSVELPLSEPDAVRRLRAVHRETIERKLAHDAQHRERVLHELESVSPRLEHLLARLEGSPRNFALSVSNVPGPAAPVSVLGAPVQRIHTIAEIGRRHALRISAVSLADMLCFGLCADPELIDGLEPMARGLELEARALIEAARS